jgi:choline dehydrogenase-like flavoprotein
MLKSIFVRLEGGQMPNPESRVVLTDKVDVLGMRRVGLDWRVTDAEHLSLHNTAMEFARGVGLAGLGRMRVHTMDEIQPSTAYHHMGTTRMSRNSKSGVVDENCCVHGIANVFVAGSSIFPISGRVNPTLTIVALAIRLSDWLVTTVK